MDRPGWPRSGKGAVKVSLNYPQAEYVLAATQLTLAMAGMGMTLTVKDFLEVVKAPRGMAVGMFVQLMLVPLLALAVGWVLPVPAPIGVGMILVAAMPGGAMSNIFTWLSRGNAALSIAMTALSTLGCLVTTPVILKLLAGPYLPADFSMPVGHIVREILLYLLIPLCLGMALRHWKVLTAHRLSPWLIRGSFVALTLILVGSLGSGRIQLTAWGWQGPVALVAFCLAIQYATLLVCWLARISPGDTAALVIEAVLRNSNLALLLKASLFPVVDGGDNTLADAVLFTILYCGGTSISVIWPPLLLHRFKKTPWFILPLRGR